METETQELLRLAQQELDAAQASADPAVKRLHLNLAAQYATLADSHTHDALKGPVR